MKINKNQIKTKTKTNKNNTKINETVIKEIIGLLWKENEKILNKLID